MTDAKCGCAALGQAGVIDMADTAATFDHFEQIKKRGEPYWWLYAARHRKSGKNFVEDLVTFSTHRPAIQVADLVAHATGQMIREAVTGREKMVNIGGPETGYADDDRAPLGWSLKMRLRYSLSGDRSSTLVMSSILKRIR